MSKKMVSIDSIKKFLRKNLTRQRYIHTLNVSKLAVDIAQHHKLVTDETSKAKIEIASLLHDCQKNADNKNNHSHLSAKVAASKFEIKDRQVINAIKHHTFGNRYMDTFSKIIYIADISEPSRKFAGAQKIRELAFRSLDDAMVMALSTKIKYVIDKHKPLSLESIILYNKLVTSNK